MSASASGRHGAFVSPFLQQAPVPLGLSLESLSTPLSACLPLMNCKAQRAACSLVLSFRHVDVHLLQAPGSSRHPSTHPRRLIRTRTQRPNSTTAVHT